jgi:hypothetical protein
VCDNNIVLSNESSLTGEPDDLKKSKEKDCFLLSACLLTEGEESRACAIGIGPYSQWGKIKSNLVTEAVNTPLQDKLEDMTTLVRTLPPLSPPHPSLHLSLSNFILLFLCFLSSPSHFFPYLSLAPSPSLRFSSAPLLFH